MPEVGSPDHAHTPDERFGLDEIRALVQLIGETDITELQFERSGVKLHIKRGAAPPPHTPVFVTPAMAASLAPMASPPASAPSVPAGSDPVSAELDVPAGSMAITAPMVGTFYAGPSPKDPAYVHEGDTIRPDEVVGLVEAMKIMNEIVFEGESAGRITRILVKNGQPIEYGQTLMLVEPI